MKKLFHVKHFVKLNLEISPVITIPDTAISSQNPEIIGSSPIMTITSDNDRIPQYSTFMTNKYIKLNQNNDI